ncbi:MAG TPA: hypothetical protein VHS59_00250 [Bacillota bacterium]|nr:hypothetical protein [Bacillota bacterium]
MDWYMMLLVAWLLYVGISLLRRKNLRQTLNFGGVAKDTKQAGAFFRTALVIGALALFADDRYSLYFWLLTALNLIISVTLYLMVYGRTRPVT